MFPVIQIGSVAIQTSGALIIVGFFLGLSLSEYFTKKQGDNPDPYTNLVLIAIAASIIGGRSIFAITNFSLFRHNFLGLFSVDTGLVDPWGAFGCAIIVSLIYFFRKNMIFWVIVDRLTPFFAILLVFLGLAHIASGNAFGTASSVPWAINLWGTFRHPSQFYETISAVLILFIFWKRFSKEDAPGYLFLDFVATTSFSVVFLAAFRGDSYLILDAIRQEQLIALFILGGALLLLELKHRGIIHS